ncbi:hypothetical protein [Amycolatopsis sp. cmx-4-54]|uniref:hypothetical protein n=1 Tax=Amycolatopsis sp. cmx-4-54 TaxID=2790936 RepID=UPI00397B192E
MTTTEHRRVNAITTGFDRVRRSLGPHQRMASDYDWKEPAWSSSYVAPIPEDLNRSLMDEFGYRRHELSRLATGYDDIAMAGPFRLLTDKGTAILADICTRLDDAAVNNDYVVTRRLRNVESISPFVHDMLRDPSFLRLTGVIAGVPLLPHPIRDAGVQINYYNSTSAGREPEVAKWHVDGMNYVFTMTLTDHDQHDGGDYVYFQGHRADFELAKDEITTQGQHHPLVKTAPFRHAGDTMFTRGSFVYHAVTPVTKGHRTTFAVSLFCPELGHDDQNRFWHSAPDDGLLRTVRNWVELYRAVRDPGRYRRRHSSSRGWSAEDKRVGSTGPGRGSA